MFFLIYKLISKEKHKINKIKIKYKEKCFRHKNVIVLRLERPVSFVGYQQSRQARGSHRLRYERDWSRSSWMPVSRWQHWYAGTLPTLKVSRLLSRRLPEGRLIALAFL